MTDITHRIGIKAPLADVYKALSTIQGLSGWWTQETSGESKVGGHITFAFKTPQGDLKGQMVMSVTAQNRTEKFNGAAPRALQNGWVLISLLSLVSRTIW